MPDRRRWPDFPSSGLWCLEYLPGLRSTNQVNVRRHLHYKPAEPRWGVAVQQVRWFMDRAHCLRAAGAIGREGRSAKHGARSQLAACFATPGWRMAAAALGGAEHVGHLAGSFARFGGLGRSHHAAAIDWLMGQTGEETSLVYRLRRELIG